MNDSVSVSPIETGAATVVAVTLHELVADIIPWLVAAFAVIVCDLFMGVYRAWKADEEIRVSRALRETGVKTVLYFSIVCAACAVNDAAGGDKGIDTGSCLFVFFCEGLSIAGNFLRTRGYRFNATAVLNALFKRTTSLDADGVFSEDDSSSTKK